MKKILIHLVLFLHIGNGLIAQVSETTLRKATKNTLSGKVVDFKNNSPLEGATVYLNDLKIGVATASDGSFTLNNIPAGKHMAEISFVGYGTYSEYLVINGDVKRDFFLSPEIVERNEVVVTGVSGATQSRRTPTPIDVMKRQDLIQLPTTNLIDAITRKPGVAQLSTGPAISKPIIRGLGYNRVITVNDGVRQEGQQWGDEHGIEIDEYSVSRIEILKGPASLIYGSDAMAGVVNIITNVPAPEGTIRGNVIANYQTNNRLRGFGANLGANRNGINWNAYGSIKAAADYENKYDGRVYNSKFNEKNFGGYVGYNGSWGYSHLILSNFHQNLGLVEGERNDNGDFTKPLPGGGDGVPTTSDFNSTDPQIPKQQIDHFKLVSDNSFSIGTGRLALNIGYQSNQRKEFGNIDDPSEKELWFDLRSGTYSVVYHLAEKTSWRTSIGISGMQQTNKNKGAEVLIPEYSLFDIGGFLYSQKNWDKITMSGGLRFDNRSLDSKEFDESGDIKFRAFKRDFSNVSGSVGISYLPSQLVTLKFNVARGFRAPSIPELASNGAHEGTNRYEYGDQDLKSETSLQLDAGIELNSEHVSFEASAFYNSIDNFVFYRKLQSTSGGDSTLEVDGNFIPAFKFDQRKATLAGVEFVLDIHPHPLDWLHFENTFSFVRGQFKDGIEGVKNVPFIPATRLVSQLGGTFYKEGKTIRNLSIKLEMDASLDQSKAFTAYDTETPTPGYTLFNASIGGDIHSKKKTLFSLYFNAVNLTDEAYQNHLSRLKYAPLNMATGRTGVFNMGRNFNVKLNIPINGKLRQA
jgi:iron complex outermembrane receptor protein